MEFRECAFLHLGCKEDPSSYYLSCYVNNNISKSLRIDTDVIKCLAYKQKAHFVNIPEQDVD